MSEGDPKYAGKWRISKRFFSRTDYDGAALDGMVTTIEMPGCRAAVWSLGCDEAEVQANAQLMVIAPELLEALDDALQWMRGRTPEVEAVADRYQQLIDGAKPKHGPGPRDELLQSLKAMCGAYAGSGEQSSASESLRAYEQALKIIAKAESRLKSSPC